MKKFVLKLGVLFFLPFCMSCTERSFMYKESIDVAMFTEKNGVFEVHEGKVNEFEVMLSVTKLSDVDREFIVKIDSRGGNMEAIQGRQFDLPNPVVVIPAGQWSSTVKVLGYADYLPVEGDRILNLTLTDPESLDAGMNTYYSLYLTRRCQFNINDFYGEFRQTASIFAMEDPWGNPLNIVVNFTPGAKADEVILRSLYIKDVDVVMTVREDGNGGCKIEVADQYVAVVGSATGITWAHGTGEWNACTKRLVLTLTFTSKDGSVPPQTFPETFVKKL